MTLDAVHLGPIPQRDGWGALYRAYTRLAGLVSPVRWLARFYFLPSRLERWRDGVLFRLFGVRLFGKIIPTGGIVVRRLSGARMAPYTLSGTSLESARQFFFRTCAFESAHLPFFITLLILAVIRLAEGRYDLAVADMLVNIVVNGYPMMHHRHTRYRILRLLAQKQRERRDNQCRNGLR